MVFRQRQTILAPIGLVTQPNAYGVYPDGALKRADNVTLRNPGELVQAPNLFDTVSVTGAGAGAILCKMFPLDAGHVYSVLQVGGVWSIYDNTTVAVLPALVGTTNLFSATGRISPVRARERVLFNTLTNGVLVGDSMAPASTADRTLRMAGLPQPSFFAQFVPLSTDANAIPNNTMVGYCVCFVRKFADGYIVRSVPSPVFKYANVTGGARNVQVTVNWNPQSGILAGDEIELYRTDGVTAVGFLGSAGDPGTTLKRIISQVITAAEITVSGTTVTDSMSFTLGTTVTAGPELYANPGQEGGNYANRQPPVAACLATFKGYTFYGRTTDRPKLEFSSIGGFGSELNAVGAGVNQPYFKRYGLGRHAATGTYTNASPTITGVAAADFVGLAVGQYWAGSVTSPPWDPVTAKITGLNSGAGTITMSVNAASSSGAPTAIAFNDVLQLNGIDYQFSDLSDLFLNRLNFSTVSTAEYGKWEITSDVTVSSAQLLSYVSNATVAIEPARWGLAGTATISARATNGARYSPPLPEITTTAKVFTANTIKNHLVWSKSQEPEHVPTAHETEIGYGEIIAMLETRDALWIWCTDGLNRLSGNGGGDGLGWGLDLVSPTLILTAPQAAAALNESAYGYTNQGFVSVDSAGNIAYLTDQKIGNLLPGAQYVETRKIVCERNETDDEILLAVGETGFDSNELWVYNVKRNGWTKLTGVTALSKISALAMQRAPASGEPRILIGVSPISPSFPSYAGWNDPANFLTCAGEYQPIYGDDPLSVKQYIWCDFVFASGSNGKTLVPLYNSTAAGLVTVTDFQNSGYARSGVPRQFAVSHSISAGFQALAGAVQSRFQGLSLAFNTRTNQSKKR